MLEMAVEVFERLDVAKRERILDAAFGEFAGKGYKDASTNRIAQVAGIGKGTLFYYFDNKETLFGYLIELGASRMHRYYFDQIDFSQRDFFDRMMNVAVVKSLAYPKHKATFDFIGHVLLHVAEYTPHYEKLPEAAGQLQERMQQIFMENIDTSMLRGDIDPEKAMELMRWSVEGFQESIMKQYADVDLTQLSESDIAPLYQEFNEYIRILKTAYYQEGH